jgi:hypothetical protein
LDIYKCPFFKISFDFLFYFINYRINKKRDIENLEDTFLRPNNDNDGEHFFVNVQVVTQ